MRHELTRRDFVKASGVLPSLTLLGDSLMAELDPERGQFTPLDLNSLFNAAVQFSVLSDQQTFWGIPFQLHAAQRNESILLLGDAAVSLPVSGKATHVCFCHFCGRYPDGGNLLEERAGEKLAAYDLTI